MLNLTELDIYAKKLKINQSVVYREFIQLVFLKEFYSLNWTDQVFFKGGTCIRLLFGGSRFSEDLDFTVMLSKDVFELKVGDFWNYLEKTYGWHIKKRKTIVGEKYLLTVNEEGLNYGIFISLDFSFREEVICPDKSILKTEYPVIFTSFIHHLSKEEMLAEKIRATMTREKGRDIYDLWFLLNIGVKIRDDLVLKKLGYYKMDEFSGNNLIDRINKFPKKQFVLDLRPFVPIDQRDRLEDFYDFVLAFIKKSLK